MSTSPSTSSSVLTAAELAEWSQSLKPVVLGLSITMLVLGNMGVMLCIWAQWCIQKRPMPEDYLLVMAVLFANVVSIAIIVAVHYGLGYHLFRVESEDPSGMKWIFLCLWFTAAFNGSLMLAIKITLLFYYWWLFIVQQIWLRIFWWINMIYAVLYYWERFNLQSTVHGSCYNSTTADSLLLILDLVSDIAILVLFIAIITILQMLLACKMGLMIIFSVGFLTIVSVITRVVVLYKSMSLYSDFSYVAALFELLDMIQLNIVIICATAVPITSGFRVAFSKKHRRDKDWTAGGASRNIYYYSHASAAARAACLRLEDEAGSSTKRLYMGHFTTSCASKDPEDRTPGGGVVSANGIMVKMDVDIR
ncbi:hypothetical protein BO83DRAFT_404234 [Aspergillus eucalypticola CBS 122712]|uniref:Rhodopsin domain-containing protein n=1 Tax=Aspergillus eucalypticola (strain CBS 122712 / IBT 29274) TaxID=1448314 RepID=A0A317UKN6_ASPEC|nr:uncharacterized protein BO83DRAFT_404234 [Aspergillus eucalypticola CBS 122712]PWY61975.1 hypothetical protein BO83DRAFT_404234 [Aspergillus eucalypticola CBS 122712]